MKKTKRKKILSILFITLVLLFSVIVIKKFQIFKSFDKFISWNFDSIVSDTGKKSENKDDSVKQYSFNIRHNNSDIKSINLCESLDRKTLMNEKIAPGTSRSI